MRRWCRALPGLISARYLSALASGLFLLLLASTSAIATDEGFSTAGVSTARADWRAALDQFRSEIAGQAGASEFFTFSRNRRFRAHDQRRLPALMQLNAATSPLFVGAGQSAVPVLLPFDVGSYLADRAGGAPQSLVYNRYLFGFRSVDLIEAGPSGFNAVVTAAPGRSAELPARAFARPIEIHLTGSLLTYNISDALSGKGDAVKSLSGQYPDLRRLIREGYVRYAFTRFGVPYVASIRCLDSSANANRLSCREASQVAEHFLKHLRVVGGKPALPRHAIAPRLVERPLNLSPDFTFRPPGELIANSGYRRAGGHADRTVYAQIRFPVEHAPAFANSQSFMNWGDCYLKGRFPHPHDKGDAYRCRLNDKKLVLDESAGGNYAYPWQDNFCETRDFQVGRCPGGFGHQGQDIRPATCTLRSGGSDRCVPDRYSAVAVRDGVIIRAPKQQGMLLLVNSHTEHVRFRYLHMTPERLDSDGMVHGRHVTEGDRIGFVSNYQGFAGGTTTHLHFDLQVFTRDGWVWVNPYATLIASYERLIGARGREIGAEPPPGITNAPHPSAPDSHGNEGADDAN